MNESSESGTVGSVETLLRIVNALREAEQAGVTELAEATGVTKGTVHKHLKTLAEQEYVTNSGGEYQLGFKFLTVGGAVRDRNPLCSAATPEVLALAEETDELCTLSVEEHGRGVFVFGVNDRYGIRRRHHLGSAFELHTNAAGKAMLATYSNAMVRELLADRGMESVTEQTITHQGDLLTQLNDIRDRGYAINERELQDDVNGIGVAIADGTTNTRAAITIAGPASRLTPERLESQYADLLTDCVNDLELRLRYDE
jgi:DNA-binding IclR family transcriptional regulator